MILLLAGVVSQGSSGGNTSFPTDNEPLRHADEFLREHWPAVVTAVVVGVLLVAVLVLLFTYLSSRFRLVLLDGVLVGEPAIRGVWGRTASLGLQYFVFRLALGFAMLLAFVPVVLILYRAFAGFDPATASPLQVVTAVLATLGYVIPVVIVFALIDLLRAVRQRSLVGIPGHRDRGPRYSHGRVLAGGVPDRAALDRAGARVGVADEHVARAVVDSQPCLGVFVRPQVPADAARVLERRSARLASRW